MKARHLVLVALFAALMVAGAYINIPTPLVPFTLQIFFTVLAGALLGARLGALSQVLYIVLGLVGLPVFAGGAGGIGAVAAPSFGYLIGMVAGAFVCGLVAQRGTPSFPRMLVAAFLGLLAIYVVGVPYMYLLLRFYLHHGIAVGAALYSGFLIFLPLDAVKCVVAAALARRLRPILLRPGA